MIFYAVRLFSVSRLPFSWILEPLFQDHFESTLSSCKNQNVIILPVSLSSQSFLETLLLTSLCSNLSYGNFVNTSAVKNNSEVAWFENRLYFMLIFFFFLTICKKHSGNEEIYLRLSCNCRLGDCHSKLCRELMDFAVLHEMEMTAHTKAYIYIIYIYSKFEKYFFFFLISK